MVNPTPEELMAMVEATPTRRIVYRRCLACGHEWSQPRATGACPACHGVDVVNEGQKISAYKQV